MGGWGVAQRNEPQLQAVLQQVEFIRLHTEQDLMKAAGTRAASTCRI